MKGADSNLLLPRAEFLCQFTACKEVPQLPFSTWLPELHKVKPTGYSAKEALTGVWSVVLGQSLLVGHQLWQCSGFPEVANKNFIILFIKSSLLYKHGIHSPRLVVALLTVKGFHSSLSGHPFSTAAKKWGTNCRKLSMDSATTAPPVLANITIKTPFNVLMSS